MWLKWTYCTCAIFSSESLVLNWGLSQRGFTWKTGEVSMVKCPRVSKQHILKRKVELAF